MFHTGPLICEPPLSSPDQRSGRPGPRGSRGHPDPGGQHQLLSAAGSARCRGEVTWPGTDQRPLVVFTFRHSQLACSCDTTESVNLHQVDVQELDSITRKIFFILHSLNFTSDRFPPVSCLLHWPTSSPAFFLPFAGSSQQWLTGSLTYYYYYYRFIAETQALHFK